jgi:ATP-dependent helicase/nuclease subunit A
MSHAPSKAVNILAKNLLILASAGSGKTYQLANRVIAHVAHGVPPEKIVALTFTRKAAGEFADSVLMKLAEAASDPTAGARLAMDIRHPAADFPAVLENVVQSLPRLTMGTMDSFFSRVVRGFQYELGLTGGKFDLLEGPRSDAATDELVAEILGAALDEEAGEEFFHAFRRATIGREELGILRGLREFITKWHEIYRSEQHLEWGPPALASVDVDDWEKQKHALAARVRRHLGDVVWTEKRQPAAFEKVLEALTHHTIGCGSLNSSTGLLKSLLEAAATSSSGSLPLQFQKPFTIPGPAADALREWVGLAAACEMAAATSRTRALREVMAVYDRRRQSRLRRRGLLDFSDVKILMGDWARNEDARLRREAVDFRLDARHEHWLLDEFQDTSRADWNGLLPLIDEAASEGSGSMFIVGDRKQAIYAWRGGEVGLFGEVKNRYSSELEEEHMTESWRSCPEVLELVNKVCGDMDCLSELFGEAAEGWEWQPHVSAAKLTAPDKRGEARVEIVAGDSEARLVRLTEILAELEVGRRAMTCGVLVRSNEGVRKVADHLREHGFDVIEEGRREPAKDNPVGIAMAHLLRWLANPADGFATEVLAMSPFHAHLHDRFGEHWQQVWEKLSARVSEYGFAGMMEEIIDACSAGWSDFGRRRAGDIIAALAQLDARGGATAHEAADWIERLQVSQSPGAAAVQVMTIHKSKGLGFDVVVLPEIPEGKIPEAQRFTVARGEEWISQPPPQWARELIPEMREAEKQWGAAQQYEAFCMLYVALTRAKRGLYVLLGEPAAAADSLKPSLSNWIRNSLNSTDEPLFQRGSPGWHSHFPLLGRPDAPDAPPTAGPAVPRRERSTPSASKAPTHAPPSTGIHFGRAVHTAFESVGWIDESPPVLPHGPVGEAVAAVLETAECRPLFLRGGRRVDLLLEQPVEAIADGKWLSGIIDRLHLFRDENGSVTRLEIIDFKTDAAAPTEIADRHAGQMRAYLAAMQAAFPGAEVAAFLVSTRHRAVIGV